MGERHLFVIWPRGRFAQDRILADMKREMDVVFSRPLSFEGDYALAYRRFYGPSLPDARRKVAKCGTGEFMLVVADDPRPDYCVVPVPGSRPTFCNRHTFELKQRYREWCGGGHRVHGTIRRDEFERDVRMLTGHSADEWADGVPSGEIAPSLPDCWAAVSELGPFAAGKVRPVWGEPPDGSLLMNASVLQEGRYLNDLVSVGECRGVPAVEKRSTKGVWSIGNEYSMSARMHEAAPGVVARPLAWRFAGDGRSAAVVTERVAGDSLAERLRRGLSPQEADSFAADMLELADALAKTGIVHRDLFADNFIVGADGRLKAIDWQLAIDRTLYREDPWVRKHWKFRYVVFGVNREMGLGVWNDFAAMEKLLSAFPQTAAVVAARRSLADRAEAMTFAAPPDAATRMKLWLYALSLRFQMVLRGRRHRKYAQLERRWRTVKCKWD